MKKKVFSLFTSLIMVISLVGVMPTITAGAATSGDYTYSVLSNGTVEITEYTGSATTLSIPSTIAGKKVTSIGDVSFCWAYNLETINIPDTVTSIGMYAFQSLPHLKSITIPRSVKRIDEGAFAGCKSMTNIDVDINNQCYTSLNGVLFNKLKTQLVQFPAGFNGSYSIPSGTKIIMSNAFRNCEYLKSVIIANGVVSINDLAFGECYSLSSVTIPKSVTNIEEGAFRGCKSLKDVYYKGSNLDWNSIIIGTNGYLKKANIHFDSIISVSTVTGFKAAATSNTKVKLTWNKVSGAKGYIVYKYDPAKKTWTRVAKTTTTSNAYLVTGLNAGTTYKFAVKAYKTVNGKEVSSAKYPTVIASTNPATVNLKLTAGSKKATVKWSKVTGATGYIVYYKTSKNGSWKKLKTTTGTSYTKTGLTKGKTYWFTVRAYRTVNGKNYFGAFTTKSVKIK